MQTVVNKKTHRASGLLIALIASTMILGGCGDGLFFDSEGPTTTAAATDNGNTTAAPTPTATPTTGSEPVPTPAPGATPVPAPAPAPSPTPAPSAGPSAAAIAGKSIYAASCQGCHGANPANNQAKILKATSSSVTLAAIANNTGGMGFLKASIGAAQASNIAAYVSKPF